MLEKTTPPPMPEYTTALKPVAIEAQAQANKRKMPVWLIVVFAASTIIFVGFMVLMGTMLLSGSD